MIKQTTKSFIFKNFNKLTNNYICDTNLELDCCYNLTTSNNIIEPANDFSDAFKSIFSAEQYGLFKALNSLLLNQLIYFNLYDYYDETSQNINTRLFAINSSFELFELNYSTMLLTSLSITYSALPKFVNDNGKLIIYNGNENFLIIEKSNNPLNISLLPNINCFYYSNNNLYFTIKEDLYTVHYSADSDITNLSNDLKYYYSFDVDSSFGMILKVLEFNNYLYVIQQYNIAKVTFSNEIANIKYCCYTMSNIYLNTISVLNDYIVFFTKNDMMVFDGNCSKIIYQNLTNKLCLVNSYGLTFNNKYYLNCNYIINNNNINSLIEFDIYNDNYTIFKFDSILYIYTIISVNYANLIVISNNNNNNCVLCLDNNLKNKGNKYIIFKPFIFNSSKEIILNKISFKACGTFILTISSNEKQLSFCATDNNIFDNIGLKGTIFTISIEGVSEYKIKSIIAETIEDED